MSELSAFRASTAPYAAALYVKSVSAPKRVAVLLPIFRFLLKINLSLTPGRRHILNDALRTSRTRWLTIRPITWRVLETWCYFGRYSWLEILRVGKMEKLNRVKLAQFCRRINLSRARSKTLPSRTLIWRIHNRNMGTPWDLHVPITPMGYLKQPIEASCA